MLDTLLAQTLLAVGCAYTLLIPAEGPPARLREWLRPRLGALGGVLDCLGCSSFWISLLLGAYNIVEGTPVLPSLLAAPTAYMAGRLLARYHEDRSEAGPPDR